jgi:hypothetical protein
MGMTMLPQATNDIRAVAAPVIKLHKHMPHDLAAP